MTTEIKYEDLDIAKMIGTILEHARTLFREPKIIMSSTTWAYITEYNKECNPLIPCDEKGYKLGGFEVLITRLGHPVLATIDRDVIVITSNPSDADCAGSTRLYWKMFLKPTKLVAADPINPSHYKVPGGIETIDYMRQTLTEEEFRGAMKFNVLKYVLRAEKKNGIEDYKKAAWYCSMLAGVDPRPK